MKPTNWSKTPINFPIRNHRGKRCRVTQRVICGHPYGGATRRTLQPGHYAKGGRRRPGKNGNTILSRIGSALLSEEVFPKSGISKRSGENTWRAESLLLLEFTSHGREFSSPHFGCVCVCGLRRERKTRQFDRLKHFCAFPKTDLLLHLKLSLCDSLYTPPDKYAVLCRQKKILNFPVPNVRYIFVCKKYSFLCVNALLTPILNKNVLCLLYFLIYHLTLRLIHWLNISRSLIEPVRWWAAPAKVHGAQANKQQVEVR